MQQHQHLTSYIGFDMCANCEEKEKLWDVKLNILITDFQRFRQEQMVENKERATHATDEDKVQARILTTLRWHTAIGSAMASAIGAIAWKVTG